ncbi:hypothetical protein L610_005000000110 [Aminobacter sp. J44]|nr:hypothetical protein L610_005000000110 [Aminobacter sp. J44]
MRVQEIVLLWGLAVPITIVWDLSDRCRWLRRIKAAGAITSGHRQFPTWFAHRLGLGVTKGITSHQGCAILSLRAYELGRPFQNATMMFRFRQECMVVEEDAQLPVNFGSYACPPISRFDPRLRRPSSEGRGSCPFAVHYALSNRIEAKAFGGVIEAAGVWRANRVHLTGFGKTWPREVSRAPSWNNPIVKSSR